MLYLLSGNIPSRCLMTNIMENQFITCILPGTVRALMIGSAFPADTRSPTVR